MVGRGWSCVVEAKLWLVVGDHGGWRQSYGWSWVVVGSCGWSHDVVIPDRKSYFGSNIFNNFGSNIVCYCTIYLHKMSNVPKGGKQAPRVAKNGKKRAGKKGGKIGGSSEKKRKRRRKKSYGVYI